MPQHTAGLQCCKMETLGTVIGTTSFVRPNFAILVRICIEVVKVLHVGVNARALLQSYEGLMQFANSTQVTLITTAIHCCSVMQVMRQRAHRNGVAEVKWLDQENEDGSHIGIASGQTSSHIV